MPSIEIPPTITVKEFAALIDKSVADTIKILMDNGFLVTINEELDFETAAIIAEDLEFKVKKAKVKEDSSVLETPFELANLLEEEKKKAGKKKLKDRPPIVTILGHVDHGKTTLLDTIRKSKVAEDESGGITQHITAYQVEVKGKTVTFVDTPGHQAFHKMRSRGAGVADIAIIIVAADDGVKPQTKEVIKSVQEGKVPFLVCINKIDKAGANPEKVKGELADQGVMLEGWGGKIPVVEISAKKGENIDELLETVILVSEVEDIKADFERTALGLVLESHVDKRRGPVATLIIKAGVLKKGNSVIAGPAAGKIKLLEDFRGKNIDEAFPSMPVTVLGFGKLPQAGSVIQVVGKAEALKTKKKTISGKPKASRTSPLKRLEDSIEEGKYEKLNVIIKADTQGSLEALEQVLKELTLEDVVVKVVKSQVGQITESDILMAKASNSLLYGFRVTPTSTALEIKEKEEIEPRFFDVIYHLVEDVQKEMEKLVKPEEIRTDLGTLKVLAIFRTTKKSMIVGGKITKGKAVKGAEVEVEREGKILGKGIAGHLKKGQNDVDEAVEGEECGISFESAGEQIKIKEGDKLHIFTIQKSK